MEIREDLKKERPLEMSQQDRDKHKPKHAGCVMDHSGRKRMGTATDYGRLRTTVILLGNIEERLIPNVTCYSGSSPTTPQSQFYSIT